MKKYYKYVLVFYKYRKLVYSLVLKLLAQECLKMYCSLSPSQTEFFLFEELRKFKKPSNCLLFRSIYKIIVVL